MSRELTIEDEVLGNVRRLPLGPAAARAGVVGDLGLPLEFLRRVSDRVIQKTFRERYRVVAGQGPEHRSPVPPPAGSVPGWVTVAAERPAGSAALEEFRPADRTFRAPILTGALHAGGFRGRIENSPERAKAFRVQLTGPGYYAGVGDGGSLDVLRQVIGTCEDVTIYASVERKHGAGVLAHIRTWTPGRGVRLVVIPEALPVSQWARDNAVAGVSDTGNLLLTPRWAGRGEEGGIYVPGESALMEGLRASGLSIEQSGLLFEGGNLMLVEDGAKRVLIVGEAEVHRNVGMARDEVLAGFRAEFGADETLVLPAASFHLDLELSVGAAAARRGVTAFVVDTLGAVREICKLAARRLGEEGLLDQDDVSVCSDAHRPLSDVLMPLWEVMLDQRIGDGPFPQEFAELFRDGDVDSGVGNLQRVAFAADWLNAELGLDAGSSTHFGAYRRSLRRAEKDRATIRRQLKQRGWKVIPVPAISAEEVSLNPVNGVWGGGRYFMPAYGGFFASLDAAAAGIIGQATGAEVVGIVTGETQRRGGGLHCAVGMA